MQDGPENLAGNMNWSHILSGDKKSLPDGDGVYTGFPANAKWRCRHPAAAGTNLTV